MIGMVLSADKSMIGPLTTTLGLEDLWDVVEVILIDAHNAKKIAKAQERA